MRIEEENGTHNRRNESHYGTERREGHRVDGEPLYGKSVYKDGQKSMKSGGVIIRVLVD